MRCLSQYTKSTKKLVQNYLTSVGRASNLILNVAPDGTGAIPQSDVTRYAEMGSAIRCLFSQPIASTTSIAGSMPMDPKTGFISWQLPMKAKACQNCSLVIREDQRNGQLIGNYTLECQSECDHATADNACSRHATARTGWAKPWSACKMGSLPGAISKQSLLQGVGHKRILMLDVGAPLVGIRLAIHSTFATVDQVPTLRDMELYDWGGDVERCV